ncbi:MAG: PKD domain-containing protein, partial [Bacteroidia bacterium]|nr:PKD domain-containing protein [Bacteroidia bacterium]
TTPTLTPYTMSNGTVTTCSGVFFDPAGPAASYANSNVTTQTFSSGSANFINFTFTNFDVSLGDTLFAYDGTSISAPLIGKYTGSRLPEVISSRTGSDVTFRFISNSATNDFGWKALIGCSVSPVIPSVYTMQNGVRSVCSGTFYDNGGPTNNYIRSNHTESFVSATGNRLKFDFTTMTTLNGASLSVYDGPTTSSPLIGTYSGSTFSVQSSGSYLTFYFSGASSATSTFAGWEASISCLSPAVTPVANFSTTSYSVCSGSCISYTDLSTNTPNAWNWQFQGAAISSSTVQNPTGICYNTPGTYTVSLTASNGSGSSVATQTITVLASPVVSITPSSATICQGQSTSLTASGANTYTWSTGSTSNSISVSPISTTSYTLRGANSNGCQTLTVAPVVVRTVPVIFIGGSTVTCSGQSATLTASGASTYTWSTGSTSNSISVSPTAATVYTVTGQGSNGCTADASQTVTPGSTPTVSISGGATAVCAGQAVV